jgi:hypothetical protein
MFRLVRMTEKMSLKSGFPHPRLVAIDCDSNGQAWRQTW